MDNHSHGRMRDYVHGDTGPMGIRIFVKTIVFSLVFSVAFLGVPLPHTFNRYIEKVPKPVQTALDMLTTQLAEASQVYRIQRGEVDILQTEFAVTTDIDAAVDMNKSVVFEKC